MLPTQAHRRPGYTRNIIRSILVTTFYAAIIFGLFTFTLDRIW
ncbi:hypothetical protein [Pseudovibrio flavus]|nr:hypothetical protein [Pseudovibrio flavus]